MGRRFSSNLDKMKTAILLLVFVLVGVFAENDGLSERQRFLIGVRKTKIYSTATTTTLSVAYTCYSKINTGTCSGKRRRRRDLNIGDVPEIGLESSVDSSVTALEDVAGPGQEKLVIWTTTTTTVTITTRSTLSGTTLSVNYSCTVSGLSLAPACG